jgi:hypothetical protein
MKMTTTTKITTFTLLALLILALVILGPLLTIWALNTLFPVLAIPYALDTWFAVIVVASLFKTTIEHKK